MEDGSDVIVVPKSSIMWTGKRSVIYVKNLESDSTHFAMKEIILGTDLGNSYVVKRGLKEDEEIAVNGTFSIDAAAQLAGKPSMMSLENKKITSINDEHKKELRRVFDAYFELKNYLTKDDFSGAVNAVQKFNEITNELNIPIIQKTFSSSLAQLQKSKNIEEIRKPFIELSKQVIALAKDTNPLAQPLYIQHCPMADGNKGADWLSLEKEIKNPFFGMPMLTCGELKQKIEG